MAEARGEWVRRVLGLTIPDRSAATTDHSGWPAAIAAWRRACDTVDGQIAKLQSALRADGDETLKQIAEFGMNALTGNYRVRLMSALAEIGSAPPAAVAKLGPPTLTLIDAFRTFIESDEKIEVCDDNPFGVPVMIRATLGGALAQMTDLLQAKAS